MIRITSIIEGFDEEPAPKVRDIAKSPLITVEPNTNVKDAVLIMNRERIGSLVVVDNAKPIGIITERDITKIIIERNITLITVKVKDIMSSPVLTVQLDDTVERAVEEMVSKGVRRLVVVNENKDAVSIITSSDVMRSFPLMARNLRKLGRRS